MKSKSILSVMMPAYNEERTLDVILDHVLDRPEVGEVIVIDDGSTDRTWEIAQRVATHDSRVRPLRQQPNQGKGAALRRAISELRMPFALVQDADLEYDPRDYPAFVVGNKLVTLATNMLFDCYISDMETGYKVLRSDLWRALNLRGTRFDIEPDITARTVRLGYRIHEVPIRYYARSRDQGKKLTWMDGVRAVGTLGRLRLASEHELYGAVDHQYHRDRQEALSSRHPLLSEGRSAPRI